MCLRYSLMLLLLLAAFVCESGWYGNPFGPTSVSPAFVRLLPASLVT